jgi:heme exporter protein A
MHTHHTPPPITSLVLHDIAASYGPRIVLRGISLELGPGEVLVVSGPNGSGKSTLLRLLCGLQLPVQGEIRYTLAHTPCAPREATHLLGYVAPDLALYRELSGRENLRFFADVRGLHVENTWMNTLLEQVGLAGRGDDRVAVYSSGMVQRLRYACALLHRPPVLLLDEPTVTLDVHGVAMVEQVLAHQRQMGMTIIATNEPRELEYGDYVLTLRVGQ